VRLLGGYFMFDSPDSTFLTSLLPSVGHVRGVDRTQAFDSTGFLPMKEYDARRPAQER
jgi:hypothetical protein